MQSFWMAGFEGADHRNMRGESLDMVAITGHSNDFEGDFARLADLGIRRVRESIGWRLAEPRGDGRFDFTRALTLAEAAERNGIQVLWTLMHYGVPPGVSLMGDDLIPRFVEYAAAAARALKPWSQTAPVYTPINEISYLAWAACESNMIHPHIGDRNDPRWRPLPDGYELKRRLVRAQLAAMRAIREEDARSRFLHIDPVVHVVAPYGANEELRAEASRFREFQWQAWDMIAGRVEPALGGSAAALDLVGVNHYDTAQWEFGTGTTLSWPQVDARRLPFSALLVETWQRYGRPVVVAETGHFGSDRGRWIEDIANDVAEAAALGVPVEGVCIYPIVDRPDWNDITEWHRSGLWDASASSKQSPALASTIATEFRPGRHLDEDYSLAIGRCIRGEAVRSLPPPGAMEAPAGKRTLIVLCHLRWDFVFQRPQHLLSRLAARYRVLVIEEPVRDVEKRAWLERCPAAPGVEVLRPHTSLASTGFADDQLTIIGPLLSETLRERGVERPLVWFYTPLPLPLLDMIDPGPVIFDCMDELSAFNLADVGLNDREARLLQRADLVLTGGPSLYEAKRTLHPNVLCVPSSVDSSHFAPRDAAFEDRWTVRARELQGKIAEPRLGFFGVIDERTDLELLATLADADASWQIMMVGPVVKIDEATLPRRANIHWLGQQPYEVLPLLVATWQVCLMPFALNAATRFISPTKTLEYLAAGKTVVSTAIRDVAMLFGDIVRIAQTHDEFIDACRETLLQSPAQQHAQAFRATETAARYSWDETAAGVASAIESIVVESASSGGAGPDLVRHPAWREDSLASTSDAFPR